MNKEEEDNGGPAPLAPPPKMSEIPGFKPAGMPPSAPAPVAAPLAAPVASPVAPTATAASTDDILNTSKMLTGGGGNMYKLSRSRNMRANYVDVMNPGGAKSPAAAAVAASAGVAAPSIPTPAGSPAMPIAASSPQLFIPAPGESSLFVCKD